MSEQGTQGAAQAGNAGAGEQGAAGAGQGAAGSQGGDQGQQGAAQGGDAKWYSGLPEATHEHLSGFETPDELISAASRGKDYKPAKDISEFSIQFAGGNDGHESVIGEYQQFCLENGITPDQAQKIVSWQEELAAKTNDAAVKKVSDELKGRWGDNFETNTQQSLVAIQALDRKMDGRLAPAMSALGLDKDPVVVEAMFEISKMISEASLGGGSPGGAEQTVEPEQSFKDLGFK